MKILRFSGGLIIACFLFSGAVFAQNKSKFEPLAENASLEETQDWLKKAVKKYSWSDVYSLKFKGCSLKVDGASIRNSGNARGAGNQTPAFIEGDFAYMSKSSLDSGGGYIFPVFWKYTLDLKEMDADNIVLKAAGTEKEQTIYLNALGQKRSVGYGRASGVALGKPFQTSYASFRVKKEFAEQIKTGFAQAIKLCR